MSEAPPSNSEFDLLTFHKNNYVITGFAKNTEVKFQVSAKFDLWPNATIHAVHFAITNKALWNLYEPSSPVLEKNYNPELFYTIFNHKRRYNPFPGCAFLYERLGAEHESNGISDARSRAWNRFYAEARFACYGEHHLFATATLKVWTPPFGIEDNQDIVHHLGYGELSIVLGSERGSGFFSDIDLNILARKGTDRDWKQGSLEIGGRWRPPYAGFWRFTPYIYAQLFTGYGETLLNYDNPQTSMRIGIGLSDRSTRIR